MAVKRDFHFSMTLLLHDGDFILTAAEGQAAFAQKRLVDGLLTSARTLWTQLGGKGSSAEADIATTGKFTKQQNLRIVDLLDWFGTLKSDVKKAFKGDDVTQRESFQVGINSPADLASVLERARKALAAANDPDNAAKLKTAAGWIPDDAANLESAINDVSGFDKKQLASHIVQIANTDARNTAANTLFANLLTIQTAADKEWPENDQTRGIRASFRLSIFPPPDKPKKKESPAPPVVPPVSSPPKTP